MQEVELDKNVKLLDCPGVVMVKSANGPLEMYFPGPSMALTYLSILKDCEVHSFKEGLEVKNLRGLHVIGTSLHESRRIDNQVRNPHSIKYNGTVQGLKHIWRTEGLRGLFKGNGTNCARIIPNSALKFYSYEEASKPINGQSNRDGSATMHEIQQRHDEPPQFAYGRPSKQVVDDEDTENFRSTIFNFSRRASSPESMSRGAYSYSSVKVSVVDEDDCMNEFHRQEDDDDDDEINSSYVIEINSSYRERTDEGVGVDEAIAWAKESYQSHSSPEKSSANKTERSAVVRFPDERVDRYKSFRLQEEYPNKMKTDEEQRQIDESKEMELLEEDIKLWSYGKERNIELQLSTQHYVRYTLLYSREFIFCALFAVGKLSKPV